MPKFNDCYNDYDPLITSLMVQGIDPLGISPSREIDYSIFNQPEVIFFDRNRYKRQISGEKDK